MKSATLIALLTVLLGSAAVGIWSWRKWAAITGSASYRPATFSAEEKTFIESAYRFLDAQLHADEEAIRHAHTASVRDFASAAATDHRNQSSQLRELALRIDPDFGLAPAAVADTGKNRKGTAVDRQYLDSFISGHEERLDSLVAEPSEHPELSKFVALWRPMLNRHLTEARHLRDGLPAAASDMPLLLLIGVLFMSAGSMVEAGSRWRKRRGQW